MRKPARRLAPSLLATLQTENVSTMAAFPLFAILAIFVFIAIHSAIFPNKPKPKSAAVRYGESFQELLDGICKLPSKDKTCGCKKK